MALEAARPAVAVVSAMRSGVAVTGEPAVLELRLGPVRGAARGGPGVGAGHRHGLQLRHDVVGLLVSEADGGQGLEDREPRIGGLVLVVADAGQLLAVRVGVVLLGAHAVPPLSWWVRWATQSGSRTGVGTASRWPGRA